MRIIRNPYKTCRFWDAQIICPASFMGFIFSLMRTKNMAQMILKQINMRLYCHLFQKFMFYYEIHNYSKETSANTIYKNMSAIILKTEH
jgi:hypothetical protein